MASRNPAAGAAADAKAPRPVILVTGANSGVGLGICERLLVQFSDPTPPDTLGCVPSRAPPAADPLPTPFAASNGIVLVLGCRNPVKAHKARTQLLNLLAHLATLPDDAPTPTHVPRHWLTHPPHFINAPLAPMALASDDEEAEEGVGANTTPGSLASLCSVPSATPSVQDAPDAHSFAVAVAASMRRRRERTAAVLSAASAERTAAVQAAERRASTAARQAALSGTADARTRGAFRRRFATRTVVEIASIDLGSMASTLRCAEALTQRWGYVTHVVLNAGLAAWQGIDWLAMCWDFAKSFREAVTRPRYKKQRAGDIGKDGLGYVWQCNIGAHYMLARALLPALRRSPFPEPGRIIWTGSIEAQEECYHPEDYQCRDPTVSQHTYESTKFQCEIAALGMEERLRLEEEYSLSRSASGRTTPVPGHKTGSHSLGHANGQASPVSVPRTKSPRVLLSHPGIVKSEMFTAYLGALLSFFQLIAMYLARWLMSPHHVVTGYKAGIAAVFLCAAPSSQIAKLAPNGEHRFSPECDIWGDEYVQCGFVDRWSAPPEQHTAQLPASEPSDEKEGAHFAFPGGQKGNGQYTMRLARDLISKLESVAADTWTKDGAGQLPPFVDDEAERENSGSTEAEGEVLSSSDEAWTSIAPHIQGEQEAAQKVEPMTESA